MHTHTLSNDPESPLVGIRTGSLLHVFQRAIFIHATKREQTLIRTARAKRIVTVVQTISELQSKFLEHVMHSNVLDLVVEFLGELVRPLLPRVKSP